MFRIFLYLIFFTFHIYIYYILYKYIKYKYKIKNKVNILLNIILKMLSYFLQNSHFYLFKFFA